MNTQPKQVTEAQKEETYRNGWECHISQLFRLADVRDDSQARRVRDAVANLRDIVEENITSGYFKG